MVSTISDSHLACCPYGVPYPRVDVVPPAGRSGPSHTANALVSPFLFQGTRDAVAAAPDAETAMDGHAGSVSHDRDASPVEAGPNGDSAAAPPDGDSASTETVAAEPAAAAEEAADNAVPETVAAHPVESVESVPIAEPDPQDIPGLPAPDSSSPDGAEKPDPSSAKELSADATIRAPLDAQVQQSFSAKPLQPCSSLASTVPDVDAQDDAFSEDGGATVVEEPPNSQANPLVGNMDAEADLLEQGHDLENGAEHLPEPPASPASNTLLSTSSGSTYGGEPGSQITSPQSVPLSPMKLDGKPARTPSANRLSISYAAGSRRLVIDAGVVDKLRVFRSGGRIEVIVNIERDGEAGLKGIVVSDPFPSLLTTPLTHRPDRRPLRSDQVLRAARHPPAGPRGPDAADLCARADPDTDGARRAPRHGAPAERAEVGQVRRRAGVAEEHVRAHVLGRGRGRRRVGEEDRGRRSGSRASPLPYPLPFLFLFWQHAYTDATHRRRRSGPFSRAGRRTRPRAR